MTKSAFCFMSQRNHPARQAAKTRKPASRTYPSMIGFPTYSRRAGRTPSSRLKTAAEQSRKRSKMP
jgi:hypothetical protein